MGSTGREEVMPDTAKDVLARRADWSVELGDSRDWGRRVIGNDLNPEYVAMSRRRVGNVIPGIF